MARLATLIALLTMSPLAGVARAAGQFPTLEAGFTQELYGTGPNFFGGVAFAPNADVWVDFCGGGGSALDRFSNSNTTPANGSNVHPLVPGAPFASNAGCGLTNNPDGFLYSNTTSGVAQINAETGAPTGVVFGASGNALGITTDPQTGNLVYVAANGTILTAPVGGSSSTFSTATSGRFIDGIAFDPTGTFLFVSNRTLNVVTIIARNGALVQNSPTIPQVPDGISFHGSAPRFVITNNNDGSMTRLDFPGDDYRMAPSLSVFASGGFRGDLTQVGPDSCIYATQMGTRYDNGVVDRSQNSLVRICPGFAPPPGVTGSNYVALGDSYSSGEGDGSYSPSSDTAHDKCHRSSYAYGPLLDANRHLGPIAFVACSGAITYDLFAPNPDNYDASGNHEPAQLAALTPETKTVTLTIGGDDAGFSTVLAECVEVRLLTFFTVQGAPSCLTSARTKHAIQALAGTVHGATVEDAGALRPIHSVAEVLSAIHRDAPNAHVYIAGYPQLFAVPPNFDFNPLNACNVGTIKVTNFTVKILGHPIHIDQAFAEAWMRPVSLYFLSVYDRLLNNAIAEAAAHAGHWATYVDPTPEFEGHALCGTGTAWFGRLSAEVDLRGADVNRADLSKVAVRAAPSSFHPTAEGQRHGYEAAFIKAGL